MLAFGVGAGAGCALVGAELHGPRRGPHWELILTGAVGGAAVGASLGGSWGAWLGGATGGVVGLALGALS